MDVCRLGFFYPNKSKCQKMDLNLQHLTENLKDNTLRKLFCAYLQQELIFLVSKGLANQTKLKHKKLAKRVQSRRAKQRVISRNSPRFLLENKVKNPEVHP